MSGDDLDDDVAAAALAAGIITQREAPDATSLVAIATPAGVVAEVADRVLVMYAGRKVEEASVTDLFERPLHPYTQGLLGATPSPLHPRGSRLADIAGMVPALQSLPPGCAYAARCAKAGPRCHMERPELATLGTGHQAACFAVETEHPTKGAAHEPAFSS